jgi:hypothetical protein
MSYQIILSAWNFTLLVHVNFNPLINLKHQFLMEFLNSAWFLYCHFSASWLIGERVLRILSLMLHPPCAFLQFSAECKSSYLRSSCCPLLLTQNHPTLIFFWRCCTVLRTLLLWSLTCDSMPKIFLCMCDSSV